jgi:hypothetical protein
MNSRKSIKEWSPQSPEQAADAILLIYRDAYYSEVNMSSTYGVDVEVALNRNGPVGGFLLSYPLDCMRFMRCGEYDDKFREPYFDDCNDGQSVSPR